MVPRAADPPEEQESEEAEQHPDEEHGEGAQVGTRGVRLVPTDDDVPATARIDARMWVMSRAPEPEVATSCRPPFAARS